MKMIKIAMFALLNVAMMLNAMESGFNNKCWGPFGQKVGDVIVDKGLRKRFMSCCKAMVKKVGLGEPVDFAQSTDFSQLIRDMQTADIDFEA